jgi:hypothetical protein
MIKPDSSDPTQLRISRFQPGKEDRRTVVSHSLADVIQGIVNVGGEYGDVIATLRIAKDKGLLADQLAIDPLPATVRTYYRDDAENEDSEESEERLSPESSIGEQNKQADADDQ